MSAQRPSVSYYIVFTIVFLTAVALIYFAREVRRASLCRKNNTCDLIKQELLGDMAQPDLEG
jgi:hypothetical protein